MKDVSTLISEEGINMVKVNVDVNKKNLAVFDLVLEVRDLAQLSKILDRLENLANVLEASESTTWIKVIKYGAWMSQENLLQILVLLTLKKEPGVTGFC